MRIVGPAVTLAALVGVAAGAQTAPAQPKTTQIKDRAAFERLIGNSGMTLQWISWDSPERGKIAVSYRNKLLSLKGEQRATNGSGRVSIDGVVSEVGKTDFIFNGTILIEDSPDSGRRCERTGDWRFAVTQNRKYWRLRQFEWCDGLTDYIDIYF
jgi:hypothetical protein